MSSWLPSSARVRVGADVWLHEGGRTLVGGAPVRLIRLKSAGVAPDRVVTDPRLGEQLIGAGVAHPEPDTLPAIGLSQLTVIIPIYGRSDELDELLDRLHGVEVIVVDDATPGAEALDIERVAEAHGARLLRLDRNSGPATARNAGLAASETPFVAFVDSDVLTGAESLELLLRHFIDPGLALIGPRIVGHTVSRSWIARYEDARSSLDLGPRPALVRARSRVSWMSSTLLVARRDALPQGFTPDMHVAEDVDLVWRLGETGWRVRYEPRVRVLHRHRERLVPWFRRKFFYGTGGAALAQAHPTAIPPAILRPWTLGVLAALFAQRRWSIPLAIAIAGFAAWRLRRRTAGARPATILTLTGSGVQATLTQASALMLRHWWPVTAVASLFSRRTRRAALVFAVADTAVEAVRLRPRLDPVRFFIARRLDDIAYGAGLWWGAIRARRVGALLPEILPRKTTPRSAPEGRRDRNAPAATS